MIFTLHTLFLISLFCSYSVLLVFKFVEHPENNEKQADQKSKVKFKIMSLKVKEVMDYVPELVSNSLPFFSLALEKKRKKNIILLAVRKLLGS